MLVRVTVGAILGFRILPPRKLVGNKSRIGLENTALLDLGLAFRIVRVSHLRKLSQEFDN